MFKLREYQCLSILMVAGALASLELQAEDQPQISAQIASETTTLTPPAIDSQQLAIVNIGDAVALSGRYQTALKIYAKAPQMTAEIWNKMGITYQMLFNSSGAIRCYKESLRLDPNDPSVLNNLATLYETQGDYGNADRLFRRALSIAPRFAQIYKNLGTSLIAQHKYDEGRKAYVQAMVLDPGVFEVTGDPSFGSLAPAHERGAMNYFMAIACARTGQTGCALEFLRNSLNDGFTSAKKVASDASFSTMSNNSQFQKLLTEESGQ